MALFSGTIIEFRHFIGPFARNLVQNMTRTYKKTIGKCEGEGCDVNDKLDAAHVGRDRNDVIDSVFMKLLEKVPESGIDFTVDLASFKSEFKKEHLPFGSTIKILCPSCHKKHDSMPPGEPSRNPIELCNARTRILPIALIPDDRIRFMGEFLKSGIAEIDITHSNALPITKRWHRIRLTEPSKLMNNLRSMPDFRWNRWQALGITKITVRVIPATCNEKKQA